MTTVLGTLENNCRLESDYFIPAVTHATKSIDIPAYFFFYSSVAVTDNNNTSSWSGWYGSGSGVNHLQTTGASGRRQIWSNNKNIVLTGSNQIASYDYVLSNIDYVADGQLYLNVDMTIPYRPAPPPVTSPTATYDQANNKVTLGWTLPAGLVDDEYVRVERREGNGDYQTIAAVAYTATSYVDTSLVTNTRYEYRIGVSHQYATSAYAYRSGYLYTTPSAPSIGTPVKNADGSITIPWSDGNAWEQYYEIQDSPDGTTWTSLSATIPANSQSYTHTAPNQSVTHRYRVRAIAQGNILGAWSGVSAIVQLQAPPAKPTNLSPSGVPTDVSVAVPFSWQHNPVDSSAQSAYEIQYVNGTGGVLATTGKVVSASQSANVTVPTAAGTNGSMIRYQIRTWGAHATAGAWSDVTTFPANAKPIVTVSSPTNNQVLGGDTATVNWSVSDAANRTQSSATVVLYAGNGVEITRRTVQGAVYTTSFTNLPEGGAGYQVGVTTNINGQLSAEVRVPFTITYAKPPVPTITVVWDNGAASLAANNPSGTPAVAYVAFYAGGVLLGTGAPNGGFVDRVPDLRGVSYTVRAYTALGAYSESVAVPLTLPSQGAGIHLNAGSGWLNHAALWAGGPQITDDYKIDVDLEVYAGDTMASPTFGQAESQDIDISGLVWYSEPYSSREAWDSIVSAKTLVCYRDRTRKMFGVVTGRGIKEIDSRYGVVSLTFTETQASAPAPTSSAKLVEDPPGEYRVVIAKTDVTALEILG